MPNLFIATGIFHPEPGGPATYLYEVLPALQARGWSIKVLTYGDDNTTVYPYPVERIARRALPIRRINYALSSRPYLQWADVVYTHTIDLPLIGKKTSPRLIKIVGDQAWERCIRKGWISPTEDIDLFQRKKYHGIVAQQQRSRQRQVQAMDAVIVPSHYLKQMVHGWGVPEEQVHVVYNTLPPLVGDRLSQEEAREQLGLDEGPLLMTAARLEPWKGAQHIIAALKQVPDVRLLVAGDGPMLGRLQADAHSLGNRVQFLGRLPRATVYQYMQAVDYFVLYSGYEGLPHSLLESLRLGTPVIASEKGGNVEVVRPGSNGFLVPYVDVDALAQTIEAAFASGKRDELAARAHIGTERFDFEDMIASTDDILRRFV
ncbi:MAG: glycosyltransferase family 4 protein [Anaerolineae bacterium]|nr:glycosyltransferase family 4 protein [Anaerolineae bacterium]